LSQDALRRLWIAAILAVAGFIVVASLSPRPVVPSVTFSDKYSHFLAYFVLALLGSGIATPARLWRVMARCFLLGAALEVAQAVLTTHRVADFADLAANAGGILAAWLVAGQGRAGWGSRAAARLSRRESS
jgi:VanZ family protein